MSVCAICGAEYNHGPFYNEQCRPRMTQWRPDYCGDCNDAAEDHAQALNREQKAAQIKRRHEAFPKAFPFGPPRA